MTPRTAGCSPGPGRLTPRQLRRGVALLAAAVGTLGGCAPGGASPPPVTVTVTPSTPGATTSIPTVHATPTASSTTIPRRLSAGHGRGAITSYQDALARLNRAKDAPSVKGVFTSPTGNIFCTVARDAPVKGCEVDEGRIPPPLPTICPADGPKDIGRIELRPSGVVPTCNSDTIRVKGAPKLSYGTKTAVAGSAFACVSESAGVTCVDRDLERGFFIAKGAFTTF